MVQLKTKPTRAHEIVFAAVAGGMDDVDEKMTGVWI